MGMEEGSRLAEKDIERGKTEKLILADMPLTGLLRKPLLFEPFSKYKDGTKTKDGSRKQPQDVGPVVNSKYYHDFGTVIRNIWMVYAINTIAASTTGNQEMVILIGGYHAGRETTRKPEEKWYDMITEYSMRKMLVGDHVSLPFVFTDNKQKVKFNLDPSFLTNDEAEAKYGAAMSEYDNWMNDEYEFGYDDDADLYDEDDEDYFDEDADYDYYYDLLNYILSLFQ